MRRKCPRVGDIVRVPVEMNTVGVVVECEGIHLYVSPFKPRYTGNPLYVRRDSVEIVSSANSSRS